MKAEAPFGMYPRMLTPTFAQAPSSYAFIYMELLTYRNSDGLAWPARETLARRTGLEITTVKRALRWLKARGLIRPVGRSAFKTRKYYIPLLAKELPLVSATAAMIDGEVSEPPEEQRCPSPSSNAVHGCPANGGQPAPQTDYLTEEHSAPLDEVGEQILNSGLLGGLLPKDQVPFSMKLSQRCAERGIPARQLEELFQRAFHEGSRDPLSWFVVELADIVGE